MDARRPGSVFSTTFRYSLISLVELAREARILQTRQIAARFELSPTTSRWCCGTCAASAWWRV